MHAVVARARAGHSLRARLILLVMLSLVPAIGLSGALMVAVSQRFMAMHNAREGDLVQDLRAGVDRALEIAFRFASTIAVSPSGAEASEERLLDVAEGFGLAIILRDAAGEPMPARGAASAGQAAAIPERVLGSLRPGGLPILTDALPDPVTGRPVAHVVARRAGGGIVDVAVGQAQFRPLIAAGSLLEPARIMLADGAGVVMVSGDPKLVGKTLSPALRRDAAAASGRAVTEWPDGARFAVAFGHPQHAPGWTVSVWDPQPFRAAIWRFPMEVWAGFVVIAIGISIIAAAGLARRLVRPLEAITRHARAAVGGSDAPLLPVPTSSVQEFEALRVALARAAVVLRHRAATERSALREARDGQMLLASVINASADGISVRDLEGRDVLTNAAAAGILATAHDPATDGRLCQLDREVQTSGQTQSTEIELARGEAASRRIWMVKSPWRDAASTICGVVTVMRDVTEQRRDEARLHVLQADQADASVLSAMGVMAAGLAHDLNQPLAAASNFLGAAAHLLDLPDTTDLPQAAKARDAVGEAVAQVMRAGEIVRALRTFLAEGDISPSEVAVASLLADACAVARADGSLGGVRLELAFVPERLRVRADARQMRQVLLNLIRNAAEAVHEAASGVGLIRVAAARDEAGRVVMTVGDSGPGIACEVVGRLFEPFVSTKRLGLGIGLAICRTIVEAHGGELVAGRAPDGLGGAMFSIVLPACAWQDEP